MEQEDFFELFFTKLREELGDDEFVDSIKTLLETKRFNESNYLKVIKGEKQ